MNSASRCAIFVLLLVAIFTTKAAPLDSATIQHSLLLSDASDLQISIRDEDDNGKDDNPEDSDDPNDDENDKDKNGNGNDDGTDDDKNGDDDRNGDDDKNENDDDKDDRDDDGSSGGSSSSTTLPGVATGATGNDPVCFPGGALVTLRCGNMKRMSDLVIGDVIAVGDGEYSEVFMFTHKLSDVQETFVQLSAAAGQRIRLTPGHFIPINGVYTPAHAAKVGDVVQLADGVTSSIVAVDTVVDTGLYNPQTAHGDIIVNGVRASTYTTAVAPAAAHALLSPLRALFAKFDLSMSVLDTHAHQLAAFAPKVPNSCAA